MNRLGENVLLEGLGDGEQRGRGTGAGGQGVEMEKRFDVSSSLSSELR